MEKNKKLNAKDLINIGIFTAIYMVLGIVIACTLGYVPIMFLLLSIISPLVGGIPMMLYYSKIKKFGMLMITIIINGLIMLLTGMGYYTLILGLVFGLFAELIIKAANYKSTKMSILSYAVFSITAIGNYVPWLFATEEKIASTSATYGAEYTSTVAGYFTNPWVFVILIAACFAGGLIGGILGTKIFKKHFERSGIV